MRLARSEGGGDGREQAHTLALPFDQCCIGARCSGQRKFDIAGIRTAALTLCGQEHHGKRKFILSTGGTQKQKVRLLQPIAEH